MMIEQTILEGIRQARDRSGSQIELARRSGLSQGQLSDYLCGRRKIGNMAVGTLGKLFPELIIQFWPSDRRKTEDVVEEEIFDLVRALEPEEKIRCLKLLAAKFPSRVLAEDESHAGRDDGADSPGRSKR